jgi:hypothetical protein
MTLYDKGRLQLSQAPSIDNEPFVRKSCVLHHDNRIETARSPIGAFRSIAAGSTNTGRSTRST